MSLSSNPFLVALAPIEKIMRGISRDLPPTERAVKRLEELRAELTRNDTEIAENTAAVAACETMQARCLVEGRAAPVEDPKLAARSEALATKDKKIRAAITIAEGDLAAARAAADESKRQAILDDLRALAQRRDDLSEEMQRAFETASHCMVELLELGAAMLRKAGSAAPSIDTTAFYNAAVLQAVHHELQRQRLLPHPGSVALPPPGAFAAEQRHASRSFVGEVEKKIGLLERRKAAKNF